MTKYCAKCGAQNDDEGVFCTACGSPFSAPRPSSSQGEVAKEPVHSFLVQMAKGGHQLVFSEYQFKDSAGGTAFVVRRTSTLHENYDILDAGGQSAGSLNHKAGLTQTSMELYDSGRALACVIHFKGHQPGTAFPNSWLEDPRGSRTGAVTYSFPINFRVSRQDGSLVLGTTASLEGGLLNELRELGSSKSSVQVFEAGLPLWQAAGLVVAADVGRRTTGRSHSSVRF